MKLIGLKSDWQRNDIIMGKEGDNDGKLNCVEQARLDYRRMML